MLGRREDQRGGDVLVVSKPHLSNSHGKLGSSAGCPPPAQGWRSPGVRPHLSGGDRSRGGREGAGEWGAAEAGQGRGPWGPQKAGGEGGAADSPQHSTTVGDGVLITGVDAYRHKTDTEGSLVTPPPRPTLVGWLEQPLPKENTPLDLATHQSHPLAAKMSLLAWVTSACHACLFHCPAKPGEFPVFLISEPKLG